MKKQTQKLFLFFFFFISKNKKWKKIAFLPRFLILLKKKIEMGKKQIKISFDFFFQLETLSFSFFF
jgi:hypothetical protein